MVINGKGGGDGRGEVVEGYGDGPAKVASQLEHRLRRCHRHSRTFVQPFVLFLRFFRVVDSA